MANKGGHMVRCPQCGVLYDNRYFGKHARTPKHRAAMKSIGEKYRAKRKFL